MRRMILALCLSGLGLPPRLSAEINPPAILEEVRINFDNSRYAALGTPVSWPGPPATPVGMPVPVGTSKPGSVEHGARSEPGPRDLPDECGKKRWAVKTASDPDASQIKEREIVNITVRELMALPRPAHLPRESRLPEEKKVYRVRANVLGFMMEEDRDFHVVIASPDNPEETMIVEFSDPDCPGARDSRFKDKFTEARTRFEQRFGVPSRKFHALAEPVPAAIIGIGFFDFIHGQMGVALNGIELHPVLDIDFAPSAEAGPETEKPKERSLFRDFWRRLWPW